MKRIYFLFAGLVVMTSSWAQITITSADFPAPNDTVIVSSSNETNIDLATTGANSVWDYSSISVDDQQLDTFYAVSDADFLYQLSFNNALSAPNYVSDYYRPWFGGGLSQMAQFGVGIESPVLFTKVSADSVYNPGLGMEMGGFAVPARSDTIDVQYMLPMEYGDSWVSRSYTNLDLNPTYNGIYIRYQQRNSIVDGWGTVSTPYGTFDAIRVKSLVSATDSLYIDLGFGGNWIELPTPDQIEYEWYANGQKIPVFKVVTSDIGGTETITSVEFKDYDREGVGIDEVKFKTKVYPNPAEDNFSIEFNSTPSLIEISDVSGKVIFRDSPSSNQISVSCADWKPGVYLIRSYGTAGESVSKLLIQ